MKDSARLSNLPIGMTRHYKSKVRFLRLFNEEKPVALKNVLKIPNKNIFPPFDVYKLLINIALISL